MGSAWYRTSIMVPAIPKDKKSYFWIGATDGRVKLFVNGRHVPYVNEKGEPVDSVSGYCQPFSFDISSAIIPNAVNQITLYCTRETVNELGTGGLLSPAAIYVPEK